MILHRVLPIAKRLISERVQPGETVVDATAGNGNDTLFLAELVGDTGHVIAFDIQPQALKTTHSHLGNLADRASLILDSHANVRNYVHGEIGGAMFNLGYLPYSDDQSIITTPDSTIAALDALLGLLKKSGIITITVYDGHEGGSEERDALLAYVHSLHQGDVHAIRYELLNQRRNPPFLIGLEKMKDFTEVRKVECE
ncbi:16S rRNA (cytosine(1402)-N(4))-methyltransferase [Sporosarcina sp. PTS2304]|uniref:tRNA (mnm(5)s(2)U34)-methyltransferase n=1 Tax=Sporosarcina sp. PTS2304 TaxID=2283194 RepID=UPI000E0CF105|nr:class I SAM-dependent methyltransferase [Sporosarcina sp. PTS2304]AXI01310.1 16S rRNA (cytosine(1402)-N(4))-methyltransferase [Sporosarcina sp. PTS2304]